MDKTITVKVHYLSERQLLQCRELTDSPTTPDDMKVLAQAVIDLDHSVRDLFGIFKTLADQGAFRVPRGAADGPAAG